MYFACCNYRRLLEDTKGCRRPPKVDICDVVHRRKAAERWWRSVSHWRLTKSRLFMCCAYWMCLLTNYCTFTPSSLEFGWVYGRSTCLLSSADLSLFVLITDEFIIIVVIFRHANIFYRVPIISVQFSESWEWFWWFQTDAGSCCAGLYNNILLPSHLRCVLSCFLGLGQILEFIWHWEYLEDSSFLPSSDAGLLIFQHPVDARHVKTWHPRMTFRRQGRTPCIM